MIRVTKLSHLLLVSCLLLVLGLKIQASDTFGSLLPEHSKVVIVQDPDSIVSFNARPDKVEEMVSQGLLQVMGKKTAAEAWGSLLSRQDIIGVKVYSAPGTYSGTRPAVASGIVKSLLSAGYQATNIVLWDRRLIDLRLAGYMALSERFGVRLAGSLDEGYDEKVFYEMPLVGKLVWGDLEFGKREEGVGRKSFVSKLMTQKITKVINVTPMLNHNLAGVCGNLYGLAMGSVDNTIRFEIGDRLGTAVPEIYALPQLGDRVVLNVVDALICQYQGEEKTRLNYSTMLGQLRFSTDPVALDVLSIQELNKQRAQAKIPTTLTGFQIYTNAALLELGTIDPRRIDILRVP